MAHVSHKLSSSVEGALAGGGDPATSPLYVFGPFLKLIVVAGVASVTFGASIWLVVSTIAMVSLMYRLVMVWVTDGSGGSGLSEEEFGGWAVKVNAAITFIEYTLTFLVSMAAMVTFIADRLPVLNDSLLGIQYRTIVAIALSFLTGWLVNRGPRTAARAFGPATAGVLGLLWAMIFATLFRNGFQLPDFNLRAFSGEYLHFTFGGFARLLAVMTGIEVFANLVAAYEGKPEEKSNKAFGSLLIIMGTTIATMLVVGPAIYNLSDPTDAHVSVFTQTMDALLPQPLPYIGTLVGIAVLLSASAASAQGLQNLALGLKDRHYIPAFLGERNAFGVADKPVWLEVGLVTIVFLFAGTNEETYLALYAAGVFILLSMTGWAAAKRLVRELRQKFVGSRIVVLVGTVLAAAITSLATVVIFEERFLEGAWMYLVFIPLLYVGFTSIRTRLGVPSPAVERLGELEGAMQAGFGFGQAFERPPEVLFQPATLAASLMGNPRTAMAGGPKWQDTILPPEHILVPLDGSKFAEQVLPAARVLALAYQAKLTLIKVRRGIPLRQFWQRRAAANGESYLRGIVQGLQAKGIQADYSLLEGPAAETIHQYTQQHDIDLVIISTRGLGGLKRMLLGSVANRILQIIKNPVLIIRPNGRKVSPEKYFMRLLVTLDGSEFAERVLPYVRASTQLDSEVLLLSVPPIPEAHELGAVVDEIQELRAQAEDQACEYLESVARVLREEGIRTRTLIKGSRPAATILSVAEEEDVDVVMLATHGRGGLERLFMGSVADRIVRNSPCPVFLVPIHERRQQN
jgi:nucleotide-binding universal stress UspA family protein